MDPLRSAKKVNDTLSRPPHYFSCYSPLTVAIANLYAVWESDPQMRRPASIWTQLRLWIDPALASYREDCRSQGRKAIAIPQNPTRYLQRLGYERTRKRIHRVRDLMRRANNPVPAFTLEQWFGREKPPILEPVADRQVPVWPASAPMVLDMLERVIETCLQMRPKTRTIRHITMKNVDLRRCIYCEHLAEASDFEASGTQPPLQAAKFERDHSPTKSKERFVCNRRLCSDHVTSGHRRANVQAAHRRLERREKKVQETIRELNFYDCHQHKPEETPRDAVLGRFYSDLVWFVSLKTRDEDLRRLAQEFVDAGMTENKAIIAYLKRGGHTQAEIARSLGVTSPAVSKALSTIPDRYLAKGVSNLARKRIPEASCVELEADAEVK